jgi:integrase
MLEKRFMEAPTVHQIKHFLEFFARARDGILEKQVTDTTLLDRFNNLKRAIKLHTNHQYGPAQNKEVVKFVRTVLVPKGLASSCARPKMNAPIPVAEDLVRFLFACDEYKEFHSHICVQMAFAIQLMSCVGVRPGEVIESDAWYQSNEGLLYKDIELQYLTEPYPEWRLEINLRNRKGHREYKKQAYVFLCVF